MKTTTVILLSVIVIGVMVASLDFQTSNHQSPTDHILLQVTRAKGSVKEKNDNQKNKQKEAIKTVLNVPVPYHPVQDVLQQTIYVGTANHPTINGGIINAPGMLVSREAPQPILDKKTLSDTLNKPDTNAVLVSNDAGKDTSHSQFFQDNWATSDRVGRLLREAAQEGKLNYVLKKTDEMGLPANLAIVPMVESNYQDHAVSVKGAAGAWQLMPSTAKYYGLSQQDRFQFPAATDAALQLLNDLHQQFGNWVLAFAAYNAGSQRVRVALDENPVAKTLDDLDLPFETKSYVKKIMGLNKIMISMEDSRV